MAIGRSPKTVGETGTLTEEEYAAAKARLE